MDKNLKVIQSPLITVLMPVHNGEKYIGYAIESVLKQTFPDFELLIINDNSIDRSVDIIKSYKDKRIRLIHNSKRLGLALTRQKGVDESEGDYIAFLDCDDISLPQRLEAQIQFMSTDKNIDVTGSWVEVIDENGRSTGKTWKHQTSPLRIPSILLFRNCLTQSSVLLHKRCLSNYSFRRAFWAAPDYDLWTRLSHKYQLAIIPEVLTYYRMYSESMSHQKLIEIKECTRQIFTDNLKYLGVSFTKEELDLHDFLEIHTSPYTDEEIDKMHNWLLKLLKTNKKYKKYPDNIFSVIISDYWFKVCCASANHGYKVWDKYRESPLLVQSKLPNWKKNIILYTLCKIKTPRSIDITSDKWVKLIHDSIRKYLYAQREF